MVSGLTALPQEMHNAGKETLAFDEVIVINDRQSIPWSRPLPNIHCTFCPRLPAVIL
jgi:hypothetical protein